MDKFIRKQNKRNTDEENEIEAIQSKGDKPQQMNPAATEKKCERGWKWEEIRVLIQWTII